jgi:hypothetical protein
MALFSFSTKDFLFLGPELAAFRAVIAGDGNDSDYLKGLLASSITCFCFFLCWTLALWVMKCLGPQKVGGLSGRMKALPSKPVESSYNSSGEGDDGNTMYKQDVEEWTQHYQQTRGRLNMTRAAVVFAVLSIIVIAVLMSIYGYVLFLVLSLC